MGLMDKVKAQATQLAEKAQEVGKAGQEKLEEAQARRKVNGLLQQLGALTYAERTGAGGAGDTSKMDRLVAEIRAFEAEHGSIAEPPGAADGEPTVDDA